MDHTVVFFEIPADDPERASTFYRELLGWTITPTEVSGPGTEYWMINTVPTDGAGKPTRLGINGGLMRRKHPQQPFSNFIGVESVADYGTCAEGLGGQVVVRKTAVPGMGYFAFIKDTEGNMIGLWEHDPNAA